MGHAKTVNVWKCDHCGKEEPWGKNWRSRMILHKSGGPGPWDEELVACSEDCAKSIDEKRKWKKLPDKSKGEPAIEIHGGKLQAAPNAGIQRDPNRVAVWGRAGMICYADNTRRLKCHDRQ